MMFCDNATTRHSVQVSIFHFGCMYVQCLFAVCINYTYVQCIRVSL